MSNMAMEMVLRRMGPHDLTAHGFRSTFRDWTAETTGYPREVAETALAHMLGDTVEAAYLRGDLFDKRRRRVDDWAAFCGRVAAADATVTPIWRTALPADDRIGLAVPVGHHGGPKGAANTLTGPAP